jgi:hypothetical protein
MGKKGNRKAITVTYSSLDATSIITTDYEDTKYSPSQRVAWINYNHVGMSLQIQSPEIKMICYGIPKYDPQYHKSDKDRMFLKIPEDINNPKCVAFFKKFEEVDNYFGSDEFKLDKMGKYAKNYKYSSLVKNPVTIDEEEDNHNNSIITKKVKPRFIKLKIDSDYKTGTILSKVFIKEGSERVPVYDIEKLDDLLKYIKYQSTVRFLISFDKSYMTKSKLGNSDYKSYGVILKLKQILCETTSNINQVVSKDDDQFLDSSDAEN